jgi:hypothetical protein
VRLPADLFAVGHAAWALGQGNCADCEYAGKLYELLARPRHAIKSFNKAKLHDRAARLLLKTNLPAEAAAEFTISLSNLKAETNKQVERAREYVDELAECAPGGLSHAVKMAMDFMGKQGYEKALDLLTAADRDGKFGGKAAVAGLRSFLGYLKWRSTRLKCDTLSK